MSVSASFGEKTNETAISNPERETVFIGREGTEHFKKSIIWIIIDIFVTIFLIAVEYGIIGESKREIFKFIIIVSIAFVILVLILIFVLSHVTILVLIAKYVYITIGSIYYGYKLILVIIYLIKNDNDISNFDLVIFCVILASIMPRVFGFYNIELLAKVCEKVDDSRRLHEHEKLIEKIGEKVDKGGYSRWSNTLEIERISDENNKSEKKS
jgi:hypothetical protein